MFCQVFFVVFLPLELRRGRRLSHRFPLTWRWSDRNTIARQMQDTLLRPQTKVRSFFLADHAEAFNGKLYVTGGCWDRIFVRDLPARYPHMSLVAQFLVPWNETLEKHTFDVDLRDEEAGSLLPQPLVGEFEVGHAPGTRPGEDSSVLIVFAFDNVEFPREAHYRVTLSLDGQPMDSLQLRIVRVKQPSVTGRRPAE